MATSKKAEKSLRSRRFTDEQRTLALTLVQSGMTLERIAKRIGTTVGLNAQGAAVSVQREGPGLRQTRGAKGPGTRKVAAGRPEPSEITLKPSVPRNALMTPSLDKFSGCENMYCEGASVDLSILSANLRRMRTASGRSQGELAELSGLSRVGYRSIEAGEVAPRVDSLMRVAEALGVRLEQLLAPARVLSHVRFRAEKKMNSREDLLVRLGRKLDDYNDLERLLKRQSPFVFATLRKEFSRKKAGPARAKATAEAARKVLGLHDDELIRDICGLLEDHGVKVLTPKVQSDGFFGLSIAESDGGPAVVVNTWDRISVERWIFTPAHELAHLILHLGSYDVEQTDENEVEESEADVFAGYFLVPEATFATELAESRGLPLVDRVFKLKRIFRVSYRTVLYRMGEHLGAAERQKLWIRFQGDFKRRFGRGLSRADEPDRLPPEAFHGSPPDRGADEPERLLAFDFVEDRLYRLVRETLEKEEITLSRAAEILGIGIEEMLDLSASWTE